MNKPLKFIEIALIREFIVFAFLIIKTFPKHSFLLGTERRLGERRKIHNKWMPPSSRQPLFFRPAAAIRASMNERIQFISRRENIWYLNLSSRKKRENWIFRINL